MRIDWLTPLVIFYNLLLLPAVPTETYALLGPGVLAAVAATATVPALIGLEYLFFAHLDTRDEPHGGG
ncbi:hypothetical protein [Streptomyces sp. PTD5-9]|uniref:hypothetical protein n=1 Tax=Streptomyces sp. PTD5-9 TaxID=3120150 RepID=UPI00300B2C9F